MCIQKKQQLVTSVEACKHAGFMQPPDIPYSAPPRNRMVKWPMRKQWEFRKESNLQNEFDHVGL
jgi:hypothetical protein